MWRRQNIRVAELKAEDTLVRNAAQICMQEARAALTATVNPSDQDLLNSSLAVVKVTSLRVRICPCTRVRVHAYLYSTLPITYDIP